MIPHLLILLKGVGIGVLVAAPVGPVNLICIRRTLAFGQLNGFLSGLGAALGDGVFALLVAFGITAASQIILGYSGLVQIVGGAILIAMGLRTYRIKPPRLLFDQASTPAARRHQEREGVRTLFGAISSTFLLTVTNPLTLIGFFALFSSLSATLAQEGSFFTAGLLVLSVIAGSLLWWFVLSLVTALFRGEFSYRQLQWINRISGIAIVAFGIFVLGRLAMSWLMGTA